MCTVVSYPVSLKIYVSWDALRIQKCLCLCLWVCVCVFRNDKLHSYNKINFFAGFKVLSPLKSISRINISVLCLHILLLFASFRLKKWAYISVFGIYCQRRMCVTFPFFNPGLSNILLCFCYLYFAIIFLFCNFQKTCECVDLCICSGLISKIVLLFYWKFLCKCNPISQMFWNWFVFNHCILIFRMISGNYFSIFIRIRNHFSPTTVVLQSRFH